MNIRRIGICIALASLALTTSVFAATTTYTDPTDFLAAISSNYYLEDFSTNNIYSSIPSPLYSQTINGFQWTATTDGSFYFDGIGLSAASEGKTITITFTGDPVTAAGGTFASTDSFGFVCDSDVRVTLSDGTSSLFTSDSFAGFTSSISIASLSFECSDTSYLPRVANLYVGATPAPDPGPAPVPEPSGIAVMTSGLFGALAFTYKRRKNL